MAERAAAVCTSAWRETEEAVRRAIGKSVGAEKIKEGEEEEWEVLLGRREEELGEELQEREEDRIPVEVGSVEEGTREGLDGEGSEEVGPKRGEGWVEEELRGMVRSGEEKEIEREQEAIREWDRLAGYWGVETAVDRYPRRAERIGAIVGAPKEMIASLVKAKGWMKEGELEQEEECGGEGEEEEEARSEGEGMRAEGAGLAVSAEREVGEWKGSRDQVMEGLIRELEEMMKKGEGSGREEGRDEEGEEGWVGAVRNRRRPLDKVSRGKRRENEVDRKFRRIEEKLEKKARASDRRWGYRLRQWARASIGHRVGAVGGDGSGWGDESRRRRQFHSTTVKVKVQGSGGEGHEALADGGAYGGFISAGKVSHIPAEKRGGRATGKARTASGGSLGVSQGLKRVKFSLPESSHPEMLVVYEMEVIENEEMPTLLGVDLLVQLGAKFDYSTNQLILHLESEEGPVQVTVPFSVEREEEDIRRTKVCTTASVRENQTVASNAELQWIACTVEAPVEDLRAWRSYEVVGLSGVRREGKEGGDQEGKGSGSTEENSIILNQVTKVHWGWGDESATVMVPVVNDTGEDLVLWAGMPLVRLEELEGGQEDEIEVDAEALKESWKAKKEEVGRSVRGTEMMERVVAGVKEGENEGTEVLERVVAFVMEELEAGKEVESDVDGMKKGDPRYGKSGRQIVEEVTDDDPKFREWRSVWEEQVMFGDDVTEENRMDTLKVLFAFQEAVAVNPKAPPAIRGVEHSIELIEGWDRLPRRVRLRPHSPKEFEAVSKEVQGLLDAGMVRVSKSPWACSVVLVPKPDGSLRTCCDFRQLNSLTVADAMTIPRIEDLLDRLGKATAISALDMAAGYHAVPMREADIAKTAFLTWSHGLLEWVRMPMGLKNSGATYQRMLQHILGPLLWDSSSNYLDDLSIFTTGTNHIDDLARVMKRLARWGVTVKISKCVFFANRLPFLGYLVKVGEGVGVDPEKVDACLRMGAKGLKTVTEVRSFMGALEYYRKFIPDYAELSAPLRRVIKGKTKRANIEGAWAADPECDLCFRALKTALCTAPVLAFPDFGLPFVVSTDISQGQLSAILMQIDHNGVERPVAFAGRQLTECEQRYCVADKECLGVVFAMCRRFRRYLYGSPFPVTLITDNTALMTLTTRKDPYGRLLRYALELSEMEYVVHHRPGVKHLLPDVMSRCELIGASSEVIAQQVDQALKSRCALLLEKGGLGHVSDQEISGIFSDEQRALRLQLLVRGSVPTRGEGYELTVRAVREAHQKLQQEDLKRLGKLSGEWWPGLEWQPLAASVGEGLKEGSILGHLRRKKEEEKGGRARWKPLIEWSGEEVKGERMNVKEKDGEGRVRKQRDRYRQMEEKDGKGLQRSSEGSASKSVESFWEGEEGWDCGRSPGEDLTCLAAVVTRAAVRRALELEQREEGLDERSVAGKRSLQLAEVVVPEERIESKLGPRKERGEQSVRVVPLKVERVVELESGVALTETPASLEEWKIAFQANPRGAMGLAQDQDVFATALKRYLRTNQLPPGDPYLSARLVKVEDQFFVEEGGLLCRIWWRDPRRRAKLDPVYQLYVPEELRGVVMVAFHGGTRSGHLSPLKTWLRIKERFWWSGMQADIFTMVQECGVCQTRGRRPPKQRIQGHVTSDVPGEIWMLDVLHFPESSSGKKHVLTMIDVATRWAHFVPLDRVDSFAVVKAVEDRLIGEGVFPRLFITDNGSEFKRAFTEFCELYSVKVRRSVPHHAEGHGMVEAANRTISDIIGHMVEEDGGDWEENLPWARRAYLSAVHSALQARDGGGLTPQEAYLGRSVQLEMDIGLRENLEIVGEESSSAAIAIRARRKIGKALDWIKESKEDYEKKMRDSKRNRGRRERTFQIGDKVRLFKPSRSKLTRKVGRVYEGPYTVVDCVRHSDIPSEYILKRDGGSMEGRVRATAESLRSYLETSVQKSGFTVEEVEQEVVRAPRRQYKVKAILDEAGNNRSKSYLVAWDDGSDPTWEPEALLRAPDLVAEFHRKKHTRRSLNAAAAVMRGEEEARRTSNAVTLKMDLMRWGPAEAWQRVLERAGLEWEDILVVWASPPCQTFSPADYSNITRGHAFRDHSDPNKPPTRVNMSKAEVARRHDLLVQQILSMQEYIRKRVPGVECFLENPRGSLACREYMSPDELDPMWQRADIDQCAFGREYKKSTHVWHTVLGLKLEGSTGDGKCHGRCGKGHLVGGYFKHFKALAMEPCRGPRGPGHTKEKNALPKGLLETVLKQVKSRSESSRAKVVVDLCSGFQSWRPVAMAHGCGYLAVDVLGDRTKKRGGVLDGTLVVG